MTDETLFAAALEQAGPAERAAYLDQHCGTDTAQRKRIDVLLAAHDKAGTFLERPAVAPPIPAQAPTRALRNPARDGDHTVSHFQGVVTEDDAHDALGFLAPSTRPDSIGRIGHYEILEVLGHGGFGIVYRAFDDVLQRVVAVKVLAPSLATTSPARKRFLREAQSAAPIRHENVVRIHEIGEQPLPHLVMEYIPGETLQQRLDRTGPIDYSEVVRIGRQIAEGLAAAHANGLIHRDIKPSNILIDSGPELRVKITDFGLARAADDASLTRSGTVAGTPMYMAPEQAKGETLDHRADLFSLGSVLYVMCSGRPPFRAETTLAVLKRVAEDEPRPIREIIPETPDWLCRIIEKLHAKNPAERYQSAQEVVDVLADCEKQLAEHRELRNLARIPGEKHRARSNRLRILVSFGVPLLLFALLAFAVWAGPFTVLYPNNQGRITLVGPPDPDLQKLVVRREGSVVATLDHSLSLVKLSPAEYELEAVCVDGYEATKFHVESRLLETARGSFERVAGRPAIRINLRRGESIEVSATPEKRPISSPSPEQIAREEAARLNGEWIVRQARVDQVPLSDSDLAEMKLTLQDGKFTLPIRDDHDYPWMMTGTYEVDSIKNQLTFKLRGQDDPISCTYRIENDRMSLNFPEPKDNNGGTGGTRVFAPDKRNRTQQNLFQLGIAIHNFVFASQNDMLPPPAITKDGKPLLSWRVALLPQLNQEGLYRQFKLDEPWDSDHNKKLIEKIPRVFSIPDLKTPSGETHYRVFVGPGTLFEPRPDDKKGVRFPTVEDGLSQTILVAEAADPVIWTKPDELTYDPKHPLPKLGVYPSGAHMLMGDGSIVRLTPQATEKGLRSAIVRNDGETLPPSLFHHIPMRGPAVQLELQRRVPLPPGAVLFRALDPAKDKPVPSRGETSKVVRVENGAWRIENNNNGGNFRVALATLTENIPQDGVLVFRAKVRLEPKHKDAWGDLELTNASPSYYDYNWPNHLGEYRGEIKEWTEKEVRYPAEVFHKKKLPAIPVYVGLHADGVLWVKDAEILHIPAKSTPTPPQKPTPPANPGVVRSLTDAVAAKTAIRDQVKIRMGAGIASRIDLLKAEAELTETKLKLVEAENDDISIAANLDELVSFLQEERDLIAVRVEVGADRKDLLDQADARLADAKARLAKVSPKSKPKPEPGEPRTK